MIIEFEALIMMGLVFLILLFLSVPMVVVLLTTFVVIVICFIPNFSFDALVQQVVAGITPAALVCIPMFILAANIMISGESSKRLINMVRVYLGHIYGGLPIVTNISCTLFGAVSGSTQATVAAIGGVMRPMLLEAGYSSSWTLGLIINASDIAYIIPPSIGMIVYGAATQTSIGRLFLAGIVPGVLIAILFSIYCYFFSRVNNIGRYPRSNWKERIKATKEGLPIMGFPILILGGIYTGVFSPTEAAAVAVIYAFLLEWLVYRSLTINSFKDTLIDTATITSVVFVLIGAGQAVSWLISYLGISKIIIQPILGEAPSVLKLIITINISYFIACMFVSPIVAIYILSPIFAPYVIQTGIDKVFLGILVVIQGALGSATPPFGCDIFTAMMIFKRPYFEVIRNILPFIILLLLAIVILVIFPELVTFIPNLAFGN